MPKRLTSLSIAIGFPVHTQPAGRQNRNIVSSMTFSPVMYPLYTDSLFPKAVRGKSSNQYDCHFLL